VLGTHDGWALFTRGQRHGLDVGGQAEPLYVFRTDPSTRTVIAGRRSDLSSDRLEAGPMNWLAWREPPKEFEAEARIRSTGALLPVSVTVSDTGAGTVEARFPKPAFAPAPGQYLVLYSGDVVLGAGPVLDS
jgi:tRNA-specific 2-thiouridylase